MSQRGAGREGVPVAGGVAAVVAIGLVLLPGVLAFLLYLLFTIVGFVHGTDLRASTIDIPLLLAGVAVLVASLVLAIMAGVGLLGRSLTPRKARRRRRD
jgi:uncharacterized membrane protein